MKSIKQSVEVSFSHVDFKDAAKVLCLMDEVVRSLNVIDAYTKWNSLNWKVRDYNVKQGVKVEQGPTLPFTKAQLENIYNVLSEVGFVSQVDLQPMQLDLVAETLEDLSKE